VYTWAAEQWNITDISLGVLVLRPTAISHQEYDSLHLLECDSGIGLVM
jgi:hypothetical protein